MMLADEALERFCAELDRKDRVLDIGSGNGAHAHLMRDRTGAQVFTCDASHVSDFCGVYPAVPGIALNGPFTAIWASHVLEHAQNVGIFLHSMRRDVCVGGLICVTVPPAKHAIVGGHLTLWNEGLLLYNLVRAGFNCHDARIGVYGYNISVLMRNRPIPRMPALREDMGDLEVLAEFFPVPIAQGLDGRIGNVNW